MNDVTKWDLIAACREDFPTFAEVSIGELVPNFIWAPSLSLITSRVEDVLLGKERRLSIAVPPRHAKTLLCSVLGTAWLLGRQPATQVLGVSHSLSLSRDIADLTLRLMSKPFYNECFPNTKLRSDRIPVLDFTTTAGGGRLTGSFESNLTGRGADVIIVDDAHSAQEVASAAVRERTIRSFDEMVVHRLNDPRTGRIIIVAQRLHEFDLSGVVESRGFPTLTLPFEANREEAYDYKGGVFIRHPGDVLHPERYGPDEIATLKRDTPPHVFATQYQQMPRAMEGGEIGRSDFPRTEFPPAGEVIFSWDIASTTRESSSNSVCLVFTRMGDTSYLRHVWKGRVNFGDLKNIARDLHARFKPTRHLIEAASLGAALASELSEMGAAVEQLSTGGAGKVARLEAQLHQIKARRIFIPDTAEWIDEFLEELVAFPNGSRDDQVDALSQYLKWTTDGLNVPERAPCVSAGFGGARGGRKADSARYKDMMLRMNTRRY